MLVNPFKIYKPFTNPLQNIQKKLQMIFMEFSKKNKLFPPNI